MNRMQETSPPLTILEIGTLVVAAWGALTGTAALIHNWVVSRRDRGYLHVEACLTASDTMPPELNLRARITNTGRRPVTCASYGLERPWFTFLPWAVPPWRKVFSRDFRDTHTQPLLEGDRRKLALPKIPQDALRTFVQLRIVDTLGRNWTTRIPRAGQRIIEERTVAAIESLSIGASGKAGAVDLALYPPTEGGAMYRLQAHFHTRQHRVISRYRSLEDATIGLKQAATIGLEHFESGGRVAPPTSLPGAVSSYAWTDAG